MSTNYGNDEFPLFIWHPYCLNIYWQYIILRCPCLFTFSSIAFLVCRSWNSEALHFDCPMFLACPEQIRSPSWKSLRACSLERDHPVCHPSASSFSFPASLPSVRLPTLIFVTQREYFWCGRRRFASTDRSPSVVLRGEWERWIVLIFCPVSYIEFLCNHCCLLYHSPVSWVAGSVAAAIRSSSCATRMQSWSIFVTLRGVTTSELERFLPCSANSSFAGTYLCTCPCKPISSIMCDTLSNRQTSKLQSIFLKSLKVFDQSEICPRRYDIPVSFCSEYCRLFIMSSSLTRRKIS